MRPTEPAPPARIVAAGVHAAGSGYPNGANTLVILRRLGVEVIDVSEPLADEPWKLRTASIPAKCAKLARLVFANLRSLARSLRAVRTEGAPAFVYVRHPFQLFMLLVAALPTRWRPACIVEAYLSAWDVYRDRGAGSTSTRFVRRLERIALRAAARVIVDTEANRALMIDHLGVAPERIVSMPLAIDEATTGTGHAKTRPRIVYVGTFVPLHGIARIVELVDRLDDGSVEFVFAGDGQDAPLLAAYLERRPSPRVEWRRDWLDASQVASLVRSADVCIGVLGGDAKASRVLPFKVYQYLAQGKVVATQAALSTPSGVPYPPIVAIDPSDVADAAVRIRALLEDREALGRRGVESAAFYREHLSNDAVATRWRTLLSDVLRSRRD